MKLKKLAAISLSLLALIASGCSKQDLGKYFFKSNGNGPVTSSLSDKVFMGDMIVEKSVIANKTGTVLSGGVQTATIKLGVSRWPGGVIPVVFYGGVDDAKKQIFFQACSQWGQVANIR